MTTNNTNKKAIRNVKELKGMTVKVNEEQKALVSFIPDDDRQFIDTSVNVADNYEFPKKAFTDNTGKAVFHPVYYVAKLNVEFAKDVKNVTTGTKEEREAKNSEIMQNATGFKAVCRDLTAIAGKTEKGFLKMTASLPCDVKVNPNGSVSNLWLFTSKALRQNWLDMVQSKVNNGSYRLATEKPNGKRKSKTVEKYAILLGLSYEEAEKIAKEKGLIK